jgi:hypothetical protein
MLTYPTLSYTILYPKPKKCALTEEMLSVTLKLARNYRCYLPSVASQLVTSSSTLGSNLSKGDVCALSFKAVCMNV